MLETYRYNAGRFPVEFIPFVLTGSDVLTFLQKQSTFNFSNLEPSQFHLVSFLDPQGRVEFYGWALKSNQSVELLVPPSLRSQALTRLEKFLISEDVEINVLEPRTYWVVVGPGSSKISEGYQGVMFDEPAVITLSPLSSIPLISSEEVELWRSLSGWPDFQARGFANELINNLRLFDLSVSMNKGCYPGQETVSKIATRRGAAYSPVLIELPNSVPAGSIICLDKKIGKVESCHAWANSYFACAFLLRDFRVEGMELNFKLDDKDHKGFVRYYPLLSGDPKAKARELFYEATEDFQRDKLNTAEEKLKKAIELDPSFADAFESLGVMLGRQERFQEAIVLMDQLSHVDPSSVLAHTNKSLYLMRLGKIEEAEQEKSLATVKSFQKFGEEARQKEIEQKALAAQQQEWNRREEMFRQVLEIDGEDTLANYGIGSIAVERKEWPRAITHLEKVIAADTNYSVAYLALGKAYKGVGLIEKAREVWKSGISVAAKKGDLMPANQMQAELSQL